MKIDGVYLLLDGLELLLKLQDVGNDAFEELEKARQLWLRRTKLSFVTSGHSYRFDVEVVVVAEDGEVVVVLQMSGREVLKKLFLGPNSMQ